MDSYSKHQPEKGDRVMLCEHAMGVDKPYVLHCFFFEEEVAFARPDGSRGSSKWLAICEKCFRSFRFGASINELPIACDEIYDGKGPTILKPQVN